MNIHWIDLAIIIAYLLGITLLGVVSSRKQTESSTGYFLAGRSLGWVTVGLALFATNISTVHCPGPDEIASVAAFLCSDEAKFMTGAIVPFSGGCDCRYKL